MLNTYPTSSWLGWCRVNHEELNPSGYEKTFGNDFLWRELVDAHRSVIYWRDGQVHPTPQRKYLCILDAIDCAELEHLPGTPQPVWLNTMLASVNPVAIDAVGARLQRYDFRNIPIINNAHYASIGSDWAIGTGDPGQVRLVGDTLIDESYSHQFLFDKRNGTTWPDWGATVIHDLTPPTFNSATAQDLGNNTWEVQANVSDAHVVYYYYGDDGTGTPNLVRLAKNGDAFGAAISGGAGNGLFVAQDEYFNTARAETTNMPAIGLSAGHLSQAVHCGEDPVDDTFTVGNIGVGTLVYEVQVDQPWLRVDPTGGTSTGGEQDVLTVSYTCSDLLPGTYFATITVTDPGAGNDPQPILVTIEIQTVVCDFDKDGDVDQEDFGHFQVCLSGYGVPPSGPACTDADIQGDDDVDQDDFAIIRGCISGASVIADKTCDDGA